MTYKHDFVDDYPYLTYAANADATAISAADAAAIDARLDTLEAKFPIDTADIKASAVTTAKIADDAITAAKIADDAVETDAIKDGAVTPAKLSQ